MWLVQSHWLVNRTRIVNQVFWVPNLPFSIPQCPLGRAWFIHPVLMHFISLLEERHETKTSNLLGIKPTSVCYLWCKIQCSEYMDNCATFCSYAFMMAYICFHSTQLDSLVHYQRAVGMSSIYITGNLLEKQNSRLHPRLKQSLQFSKIQLIHTFITEKYFYS